AGGRGVGRGGAGRGGAHGARPRRARVGRPVPPPCARRGARPRAPRRTDAGARERAGPAWRRVDARDAGGGPPPRRPGRPPAGARRAVAAASFDPLVGRGREDDARSLVLAALEAADPGDREASTELGARLAFIQALFGRGPGEAVVAGLRAGTGALDAGSPADRYAAATLALLEAVSDGTAPAVAGLARLAVGDERGHEADARAGRPLQVPLVAI